MSVPIQTASKSRVLIGTIGTFLGAVSSPFLRTSSRKVLVSAVDSRYVSKVRSISPSADQLGTSFHPSRRRSSTVTVVISVWTRDPAQGTGVTGDRG